MSDTKIKDTSSALETLQKLDDEIAAAEERARAFDPELAEVEEPALELEGEVENTRSRLKEMKVEERRLELSADEKRARTKKLEERLNNVRNVREEAAVSAELDMVKQALEGDEQEALSLLDQIRKMELKLDEQEKALQEAREQVEPRRQELLQAREDVKGQIEDLQTRRREFTDRMENSEVQVYERIRAGKGRRAVSRLTADGACGNCFNVLPLQLQNEIRHGTAMVRCEACGVIITAAEGTDEEEDGNG